MKSENSAAASLKMDEDGLAYILDARFGDELRRHWFELEARGVDFKQRIWRIYIWTNLALAGETNADILLSPERVTGELLPFMNEHRELVEDVVIRALELLKLVGSSDNMYNC